MNVSCMDLRQWFIHITITILDNVRRQLFYLKHKIFPEAGVYLRLQFALCKFGAMDRARISLQTRRFGNRILYRY
jgi:hypothetical protein